MTSSIKNDSIVKIENLKYNNDAVILTEKIKLYDSEHNFIREINGVYGQIVSIDSNSKNKYDLSNSDESCNLHNFVKIKGQKLTGWVYGKYLFEKENLNRDTTLLINNIKIEIVPTKNFNIGVYDKEIDGLSFCSNNQNPVILFNSLFNKYEYIQISPKNENYTENYLTLDNHDMWLDKIENVNINGAIVTMQIFREYQEGFADIEIEIRLNDSQSTAKVLKVTKRETENDD